MDKIALLVDIQALKSENAALRECLAWYADDGNYHEDYEINSPFRTTRIEHDRGQRARDALVKPNLVEMSADECREYLALQTKGNGEPTAVVIPADEFGIMAKAIQEWRDDGTMFFSDGCAKEALEIAQKYAPRAEGKEGE